MQKLERSGLFLRKPLGLPKVVLLDRWVSPWRASSQTTTRLALRQRFDFSRHQSRGGGRSPSDRRPIAGVLRPRAGGPSLAVVLRSLDDKVREEDSAHLMLTSQALVQFGHELLLELGFAVVGDHIRHALRAHHSGD